MVLLKVIANLDVLCKHSGSINTNMISIVDIDLATANIIHQYIMKGKYRNMRIFNKTDHEYSFSSVITSDPMTIKNIERFFKMSPEYHSSENLVFEILLLKKRDDYQKHIDWLNLIISKRKNKKYSFADRISGILNTEYYGYDEDEMRISLKNDINFPETDNTLNNIFTLLLIGQNFILENLDKNLKFVIAEYLDYKTYKGELFREREVVEV